MTDETKSRKTWISEFCEVKAGLPLDGAPIFFIRNGDTYYGHYNNGRWYSRIRPTIVDTFADEKAEQVTSWCYENNFCNEDYLRYNEQIQDLNYVRGFKKTRVK